MAPAAQPAGPFFENQRDSTASHSPSPPKTTSCPACHTHTTTGPEPKRPETLTAPMITHDREDTQHLESSAARPSLTPKTPSKMETAKTDKTDKGKPLSFEAVHSTWAWNFPAADTLYDSSGCSQMGDGNAPLSEADRVKNGESSSQPAVSHIERKPRWGVRIGDKVYLSSENYTENDHIGDGDNKTKHGKGKGKGKEVVRQNIPIHDEAGAHPSQPLPPVQSVQSVQSPQLVPASAKETNPISAFPGSPGTSRAVSVRAPAAVGTAVDPHPRVASPDINYGAADDNFLAPAASPPPSPLIEPISGGGLSHNGDVDDDQPFAQVDVGGGRVEIADGGEDEESFSDYMSLSDMSGTTIKSFDTSPTALLKRLTRSTNLETRVESYLEDLNKYKLVDWLVSADMDFGETPKPIVPHRRTNIDIAINNSAKRILARQGLSVRPEPDQTLGIPDNALKPMPLEPTSPNYFMRMQVLANFVIRCRDARHPAKPHPHAADAAVQEGVKAPCVVCSKANGFLMQPGHNRNFLESIMLPMSEITNYADMVTLLNMRVTQRALKDIGLAARIPTGRPYPWEYVRSKPMLDDYEAVLQQSHAKYRVLATGKIKIDDNGLVCAVEKALQ